MCWRKHPRQMSRLRITKKLTIHRIMLWAAELPEPASTFDPDLFAQRSFAKSAIFDLVELISKSDKRPREVVEDYIQQMEEYSLRNRNTSFMFSVCHDTAQALYDDLYLRR